MWINKKAYSEWIAQITHLRAFIDNLHTSFQNVVAAKDTEMATLRAAISTMQIHLNEAEKSAAVAAAYNDVWRTRVNELNIERAELLGRVVPGLHLPVPVIERDPVMSGTGIDFEDMGDVAAHHMGLADHLPVHGTPKSRDGGTFQEHVDSLDERLQDSSQ